MTFINLRPKPSIFIKSIAEQGYTLESALADLIDNSITSSASEVNLVSGMMHGNHCMFIADNGDGMSDNTLLEALRMPSQSMENARLSKDLGRFGLGLKTASFSQARKVTVISKIENQDQYCAYCWDLKYLEEDWNLKKLDNNEIEQYLSAFNQRKSEANLNSTLNLSTLIVWEDLFKYDNVTLLDQHLMEETIGYLSLVFHRFLDRSSIRITIGNVDLRGFDPFPDDMSRMQKVRFYKDERFSVQGFILPYTVLKYKSGNGLKQWVIGNRTLSDMEGIYLYREDRLICFGGWARLQRRQQHLKLARLKIDIYNTHDKLFEINVAKSMMRIPQQFSKQILEIVRELSAQSKAVYFQRSVKTLFSDPQIKRESILNSHIDQTGVYFSVNENNQIYKSLLDSVMSKTNKKILRNYLLEIMKVLNTHVDNDNGEIEDLPKTRKDKFTDEEVRKLKEIGLSDFDIENLKN